jgi:hypothetical protein
MGAGGLLRAGLVAVDVHRGRLALMRIQLDENLPTSLVDALVQLGHDAEHARCRAW